MCNKCKNILLTQQRATKDFTISNSPASKVYFYKDKKICEGLDYDNCRNCVCGHKISRKYYIHYLPMDISYILGSCCIHNYKDDKGIFNDNKDIVNKLKEYEKITCGLCNKKVKNINKHNQSKKHLDNVRKEEEAKKEEELKKVYRKCLRCDKYNIKLDKPTNYRYCYNCYVIRNEEYKKRVNKINNDCANLLKMYYES